MKEWLFARHGPTERFRVCRDALRALKLFSAKPAHQILLSVAALAYAKERGNDKEQELRSVAQWREADVEGVLAV